MNAEPIARRAVSLTAAAAIALLIANADNLTAPESPPVPVTGGGLIFTPDDPPPYRLTGDPIGDAVTLHLYDPARYPLPLANQPPPVRDDVASGGGGGVVVSIHQTAPAPHSAMLYSGGGRGVQVSGRSSPSWTYTAPEVDLSGMAPPPPTDYFLLTPPRAYRPLTDLAR